MLLEFLQYLVSLLPSFIYFLVCNHRLKLVSFLWRYHHFIVVVFVLVLVEGLSRGLCVPVLVEYSFKIFFFWLVS